MDFNCLERIRLGEGKRFAGPGTIDGETEDGDDSSKCKMLELSKFLETRPYHNPTFLRVNG
jgi:hypothetical protein